MRTRLGENIESALERLRCNAWRFNPKTKKYDRVDEDVAVADEALRKMAATLFEIENGGRCLYPSRDAMPCRVCHCCMARQALVELGIKGG